MRIVQREQITLQTDIALVTAIIPHFTGVKSLKMLSSGLRMSIRVLTRPSQRWWNSMCENYRSVDFIPSQTLMQLFQ
jgi:hypothetical protein